MTNELSTADILPFALAGHAIFTVQSKKTGTSFTFRILRGKKEPVKHLYFVSVLTGPSNEEDYTFLGTIFSETAYRRSEKSAIGADAPSAKAFIWFWQCLQQGQFSSIEIAHAGKCARCGRTLTVMSSIRAGFGPECATKV